MDALVDELRGYPSVEVNFIQLDKINFTYTSSLQRVKNFFLKTFLRKNLKLEYQEVQIKKEILDSSPSDIILVIRPDKLKRETLIFLKEHSERLISYYFDAIGNIPMMKQRLDLFDKVFSYEKRDVKKFGLNFITNYIPSDNYTTSNEGKKVFNISSYDERFPMLEAVAVQLFEKGHPYNILVRQRKGLRSKYVEMIDHYVPLSQTKQMIEEAGILLDIQKNDQRGLTFRVFEALGANKKLITTNPDIVNYDFYNPDNILVINPDKPLIPMEFLDKPYVEIPEIILARYRRKTWIREVFGIEKN